MLLRIVVFVLLLAFFLGMGLLNYSTLPFPANAGSEPPAHALAVLNQPE